MLRENLGMQIYLSISYFMMEAEQISPMSIYCGGFSKKIALDWAF